MKNIKKIFIILITLLVCINTTISVIADTIPTNNEQQITKNGGEEVGDGVKISKMIYPTDIENYFDIVLNVQTRRKAAPQDLAVVIVMDISRTMVQYKVDNEGITRLKSAVNAGEKFIRDFATYSSSSLSDRKIGYVDFNTNAYKVFDLQNCDSQDKANNLINTMKTTTNTKVFNLMESGSPSKDSDDPYFMDSKHTRFTNIEAGLKLANDMLSTSQSKNKYIIVLSDGFPTTYIQSGYNGYDPYTTNSNILYDYVLGLPCRYGTDYSERAARRAQEMATSIKSKGIKIFSVGTGIDKGAKTVDEYANYNLDWKKKNKYSTVDRYDENYAIGHSLEDFKRWLGGTGNSTNPGIGSGYDNGYYFDTSDSESLNKAYENIFKTITSLSEASWVAEDPMNDESISTKNIEFVGIYDKSNNKDNISDSVSLGNNSDNTASYNPSDDKINWDLKNSNYTTFIEDNTTYYNYQLKYRIRLKNENNAFKTNVSNLTNGKTTLSYIVQENNNPPELKTIDFPIPEVVGYLGELTFNKISNYNNIPLNGIKFELKHDSNCLCMKERKHIDENYHMESTSDNGVVTFNNIPSGHSYKLHEVSSDGLHEVDKTEYEVNVSYGITTTNIQNNTIINKHIKKNLSIEKIVQGIETNKEFTFELTATYNGSSLVGKYNIEKNGVTSEIEFIDGKTTFTLKSNEKIIIKDLPLSINYNIKELNTDGFVVKYQVNDGEVKIYDENNLEIINLNDNNNILFINASGYELPETGSSSTLILIIIGYLLLIGPVIYIGYDIYKKKGKADFLSK